MTSKIEVIMKEGQKSKSQQVYKRKVGKSGEKFGAPPKDADL